MFTEINIPYHLPPFIFEHREIIQMETSGNIFPILFNTLFTAQLHLVTGVGSFSTSVGY